MKDQLDLATHDMDAAIAERIRRCAQLVLKDERDLAGRPSRAWAVHSWRTVFEPALATGAVAIYLAWMVSALVPLLVR